VPRAGSGIGSGAKPSPAKKLGAIEAKTVEPDAVLAKPVGKVAPAKAKAKPAAKAAPKAAPKPAAKAPAKPAAKSTAKPADKTTSLTHPAGGA
ncbi:hypothetical protein FHK98_03635, partial [Cylindrospermopsis raciborskii CS-506_A]